MYTNKHIQSRDVLFDTTNVATLVQRAFRQTDEAPTIESAARVSLAAEGADAFATEPTGAVGAEAPVEGSIGAVGAEEPAEASSPVAGVMKRRRAGLVDTPPRREARPCRKAKKPKRYSDYQWFQAMLEQNLCARHSRAKSGYTTIAQRRVEWALHRAVETRSGT
ncbi:hypothetical protein ON010_g3641 [Phytophthora cinnamomi]|nr:hypothetical protein ON010_g3641 [Phytophthora cinnamomi]